MLAAPIAPASLGLKKPKKSPPMIIKKIARVSPPPLNTAKAFSLLTSHPHIHYPHQIFAKISVDYHSQESIIDVFPEKEATYMLPSRDCTDCVTSIASERRGQDKINIPKY